MPEPVSKSMGEILLLSDGEFGGALLDYLIAKKNAEELTDIEYESWLLLNMQLDIEMEGFIDLFYQLYSLRDCAIVESALLRLRLHKLADLFAEAKAIYTGGKADMIESEYEVVDWSAGDEHWKRFDAIGEEFLAKCSEIYLIPSRLEAYIKAEFARSQT